jgi:hypothetical protein
MCALTHVQQRSHHCVIRLPYISLHPPAGPNSRLVRKTFQRALWSIKVPARCRIRTVPGHGAGTQESRPNGHRVGLWRGFCRPAPASARGGGAQPRRLARLGRRRRLVGATGSNRARESRLHFSVPSRRAGPAPCPAGCSGNGDCVNGVCYCFGNFTAPDCAKRESPDVPSAPVPPSHAPPPPPPAAAQARARVAAAGVGRATPTTARAPARTTTACAPIAARRCAPRTATGWCAAGGGGARRSSGSAPALRGGAVRPVGRLRAPAW